MAKILVVDDDPHILLLIRTTFEGAGHQVLLTSNPKDVPRLTADPDLDAVILDIMLPEVSGWDLLAQIRDDPQTEKLPIVMLSSLSTVNDRVRGIRIGADDYLVKPFHPEELLARVEALISKNLTMISASGVQGRLSAYPINELLQNFEQNKKSGQLEVFSGGRTGRIKVVQGAPATAELGGLRAQDAVLEMLELHDGTFQFIPGGMLDDSAPAAAGADTSSFQLLMMDAAWIADELQKRLHHLPDAGAPLHLTGDLPRQFPPTWERLPIETLVARLRNAPGLCLNDLIGQRLGASSKVRLAVVWMIEQGALRIETAPWVDRSQLQQLRRMGEKTGTDVVGQLLALFRDESAANLDKLRAAAKSGDLEDAVHVAHQMKGTASAVCAPRLSDLCAALENELRRDNAVDALRGGLPKIEEAVRRTLEGFADVQGA